MTRGADRGRFPRSKRAVAAGDAIASVIDHYRVGGTLRERRVHGQWRELVGDRIADRTSPGRVKDGVLPIRVANAAWMHELSSMGDALLERLRERSGGMVENIRFYVGKPRPAWRREVTEAEAAAAARPPAPPGKTFVPATGSDLARIESETDSIDDDELRTIIREARRRLNL